MASFLLKYSSSLFSIFGILLFAIPLSVAIAPSKLFLKQNISSQIVQEREKITLPLSEYFQGSLLEYKLCFANRNETGNEYCSTDLAGVDWEINKMIKLDDPYEVLNSTNLNDTSFQYGLSPFTRSTFLMEDEDGTQVIYFVDRNLQFMKFDINNFTEKQAIRSYSYPLDTSILNDTCSDLQRVSQYTDNYTIMFCNTVTFQENPITNTSERTVQTTIVRFENLMNNGEPVARYLTYSPSEVLIDPNVRLINLGCEFKILSYQQTCMYLGVTTVKSRSKKGATIIKINITEFEDMKKQKQLNRTLKDREPVQSKYWVVLPEQLQGLPVTDVELLSVSYYSQSYPWLAVLVESKYLVFCQYSYLDVIYYTADDQNLKCQNGTIIPYKNMGSIFHNERDKSFLYASLISPPGVVEIRVDSPTNSYINRVYQVGEDSYIRYIGQPVIATNENYILHLMIDMQTFQQVIRVYDKRSNYYSTAIFDYQLPRQRKSNYFVFPSFFLDIIFYRDEVVVDLVRMSETRLVLDATNSTLLQRLLEFKNNEVFVNLTAQNGAGPLLQTSFNVTFVDKDDTHIYSIQKDKIDQKILYNCGDNRFTFAINGYFNGPNYELKPVNMEKEDEQSCKDGQCYFNFTSKDMTETFVASFNFSQCQDYYSLPSIEDNSNYASGDLLLICINKEQSYIQTYTYDSINRNLTLTNKIFMPMTQFLSASIDLDMRRLIIFTNTTSGEADSQGWLVGQLVVHIFAVQNSVIWKANSTITGDSLMKLNTIGSMSYNTAAKRGVLISQVTKNPDTLNPAQLISVFDSLPYAPYIQERTSAYIDVTEDQVNVTSKIIKTDISQEGFIYALQENNKMVVYEPVDYYQTFTLMHKIVKRWEQNFTDFSGQIHDFDILDGSHIILYTGLNETIVYEIEMQIYWTYKMVLPLFNEYSLFEYQFSESERNAYIQKRIVRSSSGDNLVILMQNSGNYLLFFYSFKNSQHDSLMLVQNVTDFYSNSEFQSVYLISDDDKYVQEITLMSDRNISLNYIRIQSSLIITDDRKQLKELIEKCSVLESIVNDQGIIEDRGGQISQLLISPKSRFTTNQPVEQFINLTVITQNQGLIPMPLQNTSVKISYSGDQEQTELNRMNNIYMQQLVKGFNLSYTFECNYFDEDDEVQDCNQLNGIIDQTQSLPYTFWIEQVTSQNQVLFSFTMNRLFFMLDSKYMINILALHDDDLNLDDINLQSLDTIKTFSQNEKLGCNVDEYAEQVELYHTSDHYFYLLLYQCTVNDKIALNMATITVYNRTYNKDTDASNIDNAIKNLNGSLYIAVSIQDIEIYDYNLADNSFNMIITTSLNDSYQNVMLFYSVQIINQTLVNYIQISQMSAVSTKRDTFKVTQVEVLPGIGTHLALIALQDTGAIIVDTESQKILYEYNINELNPFPEQTFQQEGDLEVFSIAGNWPYSFHILSNYGLYIFTFETNLTDRAAVVLGNTQKVLTPLSKRCIQLYFDRYSYQLAANSYGYAFLVTRNTSASTFEVFLGGVSFNSLQNSKVLRMIKITENQNCISLNQEPYLASSEEDQIAVSFVCDTQLQIVRLCMRPHFITNMSPFNETATRLDRQSGVREPGVLQFSQFNITVNATNAYTIPDLQSNLIHISLEYEASKTSSQLTMSMVYFALIVLLIVSFLSLTYLNYRGQEARLIKKREEDYNFNYYQRTSRYSSRATRLRSTRSHSHSRRSHIGINTSRNTETSLVQGRLSSNVIPQSDQEDSRQITTQQSPLIGKGYLNTEDFTQSDNDMSPSASQYLSNRPQRFQFQGYNQRGNKKRSLMRDGSFKYFDESFYAAEGGLDLQQIFNEENKRTSTKDEIRRIKTNEISAGEKMPKLGSPRSKSIMPPVYALNDSGASTKGENLGAFDNSEENIKRNNKPSYQKSTSTNNITRFQRLQEELRQSGKDVDQRHYQHQKGEQKKTRLLYQ